LDRNRNKLTRAEQARQRTLRIGIVGVSAGHSIAHVLAMEGLAGEIRLADFDVLELSNLNRIPASVLDLGVNKAVVAARRIAEIDPYLHVTVVPEGIRPDNLSVFLDGLDLVIEECDSLDVKMLVREAARERAIPVIMETSDRGVLDVERFDLEPDRPSSTVCWGISTRRSCRASRPNRRVRSCFACLVRATSRLEARHRSLNWVKRSRAGPSWRASDPRRGHRRGGGTPIGPGGGVAVGSGSIRRGGNPVGSQAG